MTTPHQPISRRRLARTAAWAVPAAAVAVSAPAVAASPFQCPSRTYTAESPGSGVGRTTGTWRVPAGVTRICVTVVGGGGGGAANGSTGGAGTRITGDLAVTPGTVLTLTVGAGGVRPPTTGVRVPPDATGGGGYGKGGDVIFNGSRAALPAAAAIDIARLTRSLIATVHGHCSFALGGTFALLEEHDPVGSALARVRESLTMHGAATPL